MGALWAASSLLVCHSGALSALSLLLLFVLFVLFFLYEDGSALYMTRAPLFESISSAR